MKKKLIISEEEKRSILDLHKSPILKEQSRQLPLRTTTTTTTQSKTIQPTNPVTTTTTTTNLDIINKTFNLYSDNKYKMYVGTVLVESVNLSPDKGGVEVLVKKTGDWKGGAFDFIYKKNEEPKFTLEFSCREGNKLFTKEKLGFPNLYAPDLTAKLIEQSCEASPSGKLVPKTTITKFNK